MTRPRQSDGSKISDRIQINRHQSAQDKMRAFFSSLLSLNFATKNYSEGDA